MYNKPDGMSLQTANKKLVTFAFTRHPFQRLVSAYNRNFVQRMGWFAGSSGPMKFAKYVIENILKDHIIYGARPNDHSDQHQMTLHFIPQYVTCPHCQLEFDLVGKLENLESDTAFLAQHLGLKVKRVLYNNIYLNTIHP